MEEGSVGYDIALPPDFGNLVMPYNSRRTIDTGIVIKPPMKCLVLIVPRSSSRKKGIRISNTIGVVDPSYCGQDDNLIVDLTREPKKSTFVGKVSKEDVPNNRDACQAYCTLHDFEPHLKNRMFLQSYYDPDKREYHIYEEGEDDLVVYGKGERFCQILFLPYYKPSLLEAKLEEFGIENRGGFGSTGQ